MFKGDKKPRRIITTLSRQANGYGWKIISAFDKFADKKIRGTFGTTDTVVSCFIETCNRDVTFIRSGISNRRNRYDYLTGTETGEMIPFCLAVRSSVF